MATGLLSFAVVAAPNAAASPARLTVGSLTLNACDAVRVEGSQAWCGTLSRPWDPGDPKSESFGLGFVLTLPTGAAQSAAISPKDQQTSAIVALQGGPGYGGISSGTSFAEQFGDELRTRGFLVFDQRGTGQSAAVDCDAEIDAHDTWRASIAACAAKLGDHADLFGSALAADDLAALITALGLGPINVYGVSYGTFLAQVFAGRHPALARSALLDSAYPVIGERGWVETLGPSLTEALDLACARAPMCAQIPGRSSHRLARVLTMLRRSPIRILAPAPDGSRSRVDITPEALAEAIIDGGYGGTTYADIDAALRAALTGDWLPLGRLLNESSGARSAAHGDGSTEGNSGLMYSVICQDYPQIVDMTKPPAMRDRQYAAAVKAEAAATPTLYAPFTVAEFMKTSWWDLESCLDWPTSTRYPSRPPVPPTGTYGAQPTLVLSGDLDLVTTVREGAMVTAQFPNARQIIVASGTHGLAGDTCVDGIMQEFVREPQAVVDGTGGGCAAEAPAVRLVSAYPRTSRGISTPTAAARTVADLFNRWRNGPDKETITGYGLRGGTWRAVGYDTVRMTLNQVRLFEDLPVSGTVIWDEQSDVHAHLTARGQTFTLSWNDNDDPTLATSERSL